jgi:hypothetical protein
MKTLKKLLALLVISTVITIVSCKDDDDSSPNVYFKANIQLNSQPAENFESDSYHFDARIDTLANDTLIFEGYRSSDESYLYFNLITDDIYDFQSGDSISIPFDIPSGTEVFCSLLINSLSTTIFQPAWGSEQGKIYIDEIDYSKNYIKGRFYGTFYSFNDTLTVTDAEFRIDE